MLKISTTFLNQVKIFGQYFDHHNTPAVNDHRFLGGITNLALGNTNSNLRLLEGLANSARYKAIVYLRMITDQRPLSLPNLGNWTPQQSAT